MKINLISLLILLSSLTISGCATEGIFAEGGSVEVARDDAYVKVVFNDHDRDRIYHYYSYTHDRRGHRHLPPGLAKRRQLPPGLQKRLDRGEPLPPGLERRRLPEELERDLTVLPKGYVRIKIEGSILILNEQTNVVVDVINDID